MAASWSRLSGCHGQEQEDLNNTKQYTFSLRKVVCGGVFCTFPYDWGLFVVSFLHFAKKYRCVPKIGFPADMFSHVPSFSSEVSLCT